MQKQCPHIWSILNERAKRRPPKGFDEFLSGQYIEEGRALLRFADRRLAALIAKTSHQLVGDTYRRDLSAVDSERRLAELLCEITLADALGGVSSVPPILRPKTGVGTEYDVRVVVESRVLHWRIETIEGPLEGRHEIDC